MEKGRAYHSSLFHMRLIFDGSTKKSRLSVVAPQKIAKKAVERNRIRRQIYILAKPFISGFKLGSQAIVFAKIGAKTAKKEEMTVDLKDLFVKADLIK